jgi:hypothetical protein
MLKLNKIRTSICLSLCLVLPGLLLASPSEDTGKPDSAGQKSQQQERQKNGESNWSLGIAIGISSGEARELAVEHGLTGYKPLPPGIRKNLESGKPMPPGIANTRLPEAYLAQLPRYQGYEWRWSGTDLVLVVKDTHFVAHILVDVFK